MWYARKKGDVLVLMVAPKVMTLSCMRYTRSYAAEGIYDDALVILNISRLATMLRYFVRQHQLYQPRMIIVVHSTSLKEYIVTQEFEPPRTANSITWQSYQLSCQKYAPHYICGMAHEQIFHFQMLACVAGIELITLTSYTMAQLFLYNKAISVTTMTELTTILASYDPLQGAFRIVHQAMYVEK